MKGTIAYFAIAIAVIGIGMYVSVSNWNECREQFSFLYCLTNRR